MAELVSSDGLGIDVRLFRPDGNGNRPGAVLCPSFPASAAAAAAEIEYLSNLAADIARELGWMTLRVAYRGEPGSEGDFSPRGWFDDIHAAARHLGEQPGVTGVWLIGFGTGGALAICVAAHDPDVRGVAVGSAPADFDDWASNPRRLVVHARELGLIRSPTFPESMDEFARPLRQLKAVDCAEELAPRPLLVMHGSDDEVVPVFDARVIADAHGSAELRILEGGRHQLSYDPRSIAVLYGWLDRQRHTSPA